MVLAIYYFIFSIFPSFRRVVKCQHHIDRHADVDDIMDYLVRPIWGAGPSRRLREILTSASPPFVTGIATGLQKRTGSCSAKVIPGREQRR
jgi:hypothetical protein